MGFTGGGGVGVLARYRHHPDSLIARSRFICPDRAPPISPSICGLQGLFFLRLPPDRGGSWHYPPLPLHPIPCRHMCHPQQIVPKVGAPPPRISSSLLDPIGLSTRRRAYRAYPLPKRARAGVATSISSGVDLKAPSVALPIALMTLWYLPSTTTEGFPFQAIPEA